MDNNRLFLLDAYALIFRAYYALIRAPRYTSDGFNTSAIYGFVNTLEELIRKEAPTHLAVCFDPPGPTFRHKAFEQYKGERQATPEDIKRSVPIIKDIVRAYNIPVFEVEGYEADDLIGTLSKKAQAAGLTTFMMTPDKDFGQLITDKVFQYKPAHKNDDVELRGIAEVNALYGIDNPEQVIDILALMGDKADNIPGCPGVGEKTASKLINDYGSVENLIAHSNELKGALKAKVEANAEQIKFSKFLATIKTDVPIDVDIESLKVQQPDTEKLFAIFNRYEFRTLPERISKRLGLSAQKNGTHPSVVQFSIFDDAPIAESQQSSNMIIEMNVKTDFTIATTADDIAQLSQKIEATGRCAIEIIADGARNMESVWIGTAVAFDNTSAYYLPSSLKGAKQLIVDFLKRDDILVVSDDIKRIFIIAATDPETDLDSITNYYDIGVAHYLLQPDVNHSLENLSMLFLYQKLQPLVPDSKQKIKLSQLSTEMLFTPACQRATATMALHKILSAEIEKQNMHSLLFDIELPLIAVLADMERTGVRIDVAALNNASSEMSNKLHEIENEIYSYAGEEFNISSPAKVGDILFDKMQLDPKAKRSKSGRYSTSEDILERLSYRHPIVDKILDYRKLKKLLSTYINALPNCINRNTGKIHTSYNQTVTVTGRLSSTDPNLQNIPIRDDMGREIRRAFIADEGHIFLSADYSQIELRLIADFADDEVMLNAFRDGTDIHAVTASKIYKESLESVTETQRRHAKTANFGILYGISAFGLAQRLSIPRSEAKDLIEQYFATFPKISEYIENSILRARNCGYVETFKGRKRSLPDINSRNQVVRGYAERNAINAPVQGSAADIIKVAMISIAREMAQLNMKSKMIMQVHDELNFDVVPQELDTLSQLVERNMRAAYCGKVALTVSIGTGQNWLEAH